MSSIIIAGDTSGSVTLQAPTVAGSTVVTLPSTSMNIGTGGGSVATNTAFGASALAANTSGAQNTAFGAEALKTNTSGGPNTALGYRALYLNTTAINNTAVGYAGLLVNTTGADNTTVGHNSLASNTTGSQNTAVGTSALVANTTADSNTAVGYQAMYSNTIATANTAFGYQALYTYNRTADSTGRNAAFGYHSLKSLTTAQENAAFGTFAGFSVTTGNGNTLIGEEAGYALTTGIQNTYVGIAAGNLMTTGSYNTIIGRYSGNAGGLDIRTASNHVVLSDGAGNVRAYFDSTGICRMEPSAGGTGVLRAANMSNLSGDCGIVSSLGSNCSNTSSYFLIGTIRGVADRIYIYGNGNIQNQNGSYGAFSDVKLKENIVDATPKLADLMQVRVRNYNLKSDPNLKQIGVVAQELETIFPALVDESPDRDEEGNTLETTTKSVKYSVFVPMLIKAIQEQQALITTLTTRIAALEAKVGA